MEEFNNDDNKKINKTKVLTNALSIGGGIVFSVVVLFCLYVVFKPQTSTNLQSSVFTQEQLDRLEQAAKIIEKDYLYDYDKDALVDGAISGMVSSLNNVFSYYETEEEYQEGLNSGANGNYVGIGVHLTYDKDSDAIRVLGTVPSSPAEEAGIQAGDIILKVDDLIINKDSYTEGVNAIRGEENTSVKLTIKRGEELVEVEPKRATITENNVTSEIFASAVKDANKGVVIGTQTFGKGVVQYVEVIKGHGAIDIVAAQYFTPSGVVIQDNGIEPNYVVNVDEEYKNNTYIPRDKDTQLQKAIEYIKEQL